MKKILLNYITYLEADSLELESILHLERICGIIKTVLEIDECYDEKDELYQKTIKHNKKYLYNFSETFYFKRKNGMHLKEILIRNLENLYFFINVMINQLIILL